MVIEVGSVARNQVVAVGRDLEVAGQARSDVAAVNGEVRITGTVEGDVIVLGGDARLGSTARVVGDVYVVGGAIEAATGASIDGRSVAYPDASGAWLALLEAPVLGADSSTPLILGAKLALLTVWLALALVLFAAAGRQVLATSEAVRREPLRCFSVGLVGVIAMLLTALLFNVLAASVIGLPLLLLVVLLAVILKLWGMVALFHALGDWLLARFGRRMTPLNAACIGLLALGLVKLTPWAGLIAWHAASFIGVGAALLTKLGRREPWFDLGGVEAAARV